MLEYLKDYDNETNIFKANKSYFAKRNDEVTELYGSLDKLILDLSRDLVLWRSLSFSMSA